MQLSPVAIAVAHACGGYTNLRVMMSLMPYLAARGPFGAFQVAHREREWL